MRHSTRTILASAAILAGCSVFTGCAENNKDWASKIPNPFRKPAPTAAPNRQETREPVEAVTARYGGELPSADISQYARGVLGKVQTANASARTVRVHLLASPEVNHFSLPTEDKTTHVFITRGLLERLDNEAQLAAVLSLELAHADLGHLDKRVNAARNQAWTDAAIGAGLLTAGSGRITSREAVIFGLAMTQAFKISPNGTYGEKFTPDEEMAATKSALRYMDKANYFPNQFYLYLDTVLKGQQDARVKDNILFTHSLTYERAGEVKEMIDRDYKEPKEAWVVLGKNYQEKVKDVLPAAPVGNYPGVQQAGYPAGNSTDARNPRYPQP